MTELITVCKQLLYDILLFSEHASSVALRCYQQEVAEAIADSVIHDRGLSFVVIFPRQSGKNELQAQIETYLLTLYYNFPAEVVKVSPTWKPQSLNAMRRLERTLSKNYLTPGRWKKESGYIFRVGSARISFLSASPTANVVGTTASHLLECDEAQDVLIDKWDREIAPMAASTNATRVFWGTAWTSSTLLAREERAALAAQQLDGRRRVFKLTAEDVGAEVPAYAAFVAGEIAKHGRNNPAVRTQYFSEEIDEQAGMFPAARLALMRGSHLAQLQPEPGALYAFLIDIGGQDELSASDNPNRDSTTLTIVEIDLATLSDPLIHAPRYRVVHRRSWTGAGHSEIYAQLSSLSDSWQPIKIIVDATGAGEGLTGFLVRAYPDRVRPFKFSQASKSDLGWRLISIIETGRLLDHAPAGDASLDALQQLFFRQAAACELAALPGPGRLIRWGVPDTRRDPATGELVHDDLLLSLALVGLLDDETFGTAESAIIAPADPLQEVGY